MKKLGSIISNYFGFPPRETRGFILLSLLILFALLFPILIKQYLSFVESTHEDTKKLDSLVALLENNIQHDNSTHQDIIGDSMFTFNPNSTSVKDWIKLGVNERTAGMIKKYTQKGGVFKLKSDLRKIYGMSDKVYLKLYPFIDLPEAAPVILKTTYTPKYFSNNKKPVSTNAKAPFDINTADTVQLIALRGIGSKLSKRIITFRDRLGGFVDEHQYAEIYGLDTATLRILEERSFIDETFVPLKIDINKATIDDLKEHPYIKYKYASIIISYRNQHGNFTSEEDLKKIKAIPEQALTKILFYLRFDPSEKLN